MLSVLRVQLLDFYQAQNLKKIIIISKQALETLVKGVFYL
jgi:hypothetical protein